MSSLHVGDRLILEPTIATSYGEQKMGPTPCTVISIHPNGRFFRVMFEPNSGSPGWVEAFPCPDQPNRMPYDPEDPKSQPQTIQRHVKKRK